MPYTVSEVNRRVKQDAPGFLAEANAAYQVKIEAAAEKILAHLSESPIVLLSGPSGSGKTTTAMKIEGELERRGVLSHTISLDNYFLNVSPDITPRTATGAYDLESPKCLDMELLDEQCRALARGEEVGIPHYSFASQMRDTSRITRLRLRKDEIAIFEGIHALNDDIAGRIPSAFKIYISASSDFIEGTRVIYKRTWVRLARRAVRDYHFRGTSASDTMSGWSNVRRGERAYISPYKGRANLMFDTTLPYEVNVLRHYAQPLFKAIPKENQRRREMLDMIDAFNDFLPVDEELVSKDALIREFIGGGSYHY
ncbi:MAG: nucleoside kinase [Oscillospiraceae bacterium]|nr:nucleoside kinase [Oscillospiraceae bacterium]